MSVNRPPPYTGGCLCGQVRYVAEGEALNIRACHCRLCQKATGGAFFARAVFPAAAVRREGETRAYPSSERLARLSCARCGSLVYAQPLDRPQFISVGLSTLDDPDALTPDMHIWVSAKPAWLQLADGLPQHPEGVPW